MLISLYVNIMTDLFYVSYATFIFVQFTTAFYLHSISIYFRKLPISSAS